MMLKKIGRDFIPAMTDFDQNSIKTEQQQRFDELVTRYPFLEEAREYGVDIQMLMDNAERTPTERARRHQAALNALNMLKRARKL